LQGTRLASQFDTFGEPDSLQKMTQEKQPVKKEAQDPYKESDKPLPFHYSGSFGIPHDGQSPQVKATGQQMAAKPIHLDDPEDEKVEEARNAENHMRIEDGSEGENLTSTQGREELARMPEGPVEPEEQEVPFYIDNNIEWSNALQSNDQDEEEESARNQPIIPGKGINDYLPSKDPSQEEEFEDDEETAYKGNTVIDWSGSK